MTDTSNASPKQRAISLLQAGRIEEARILLTEVYRADPKDPEVVWWLNGIADMQNNSVDAERYAREMIALAPGMGRAHSNLACALLEQGRTEEAAASFRAALERDPDSAMDQYMLAAASGGPPPTREQVAPYVTKLFDNYADRFDEDLRNRLGYRIPEALLDLLKRTLSPAPGEMDILDLGCGTGLCGVLFRPLARRLVGVDLSQRMLEKARQRKLYDELIAGDLLSSLAGSKSAYDLVIAADVFVYIGNLREIFEACRSALRPAGAFLFSTESYDGDGYRLQPTARFAHSQSYIAQLASRCKMEVRASEARGIRIHHGKPVMGQIFLLTVAG